MRTTLVLFSFLTALFMIACAPSGRFESLLKDTHTMQQASIFFGKPDVQTQLPDGTLRSEWKMNRVEQVPGQWVEEIIGYRSDGGFPQEIIRRSFSPAHETTLTCNLTIVSGASGQVVSSQWSGNSCGSLLSADRQDYESLDKGKRVINSLQEGSGVEGEMGF